MPVKCFLQHVGCPFCRLEFTVYARVEELAQDGAYYFHRAALDHLVTVDMLVNGSGGKEKAGHGKGGKEAEFWAGVEMEVVEQLGMEETYKTDLDMFGYSIHEYIQGIK